MKRNYVLREKDSDIVFAVIQGIDTEKVDESNVELINKVGQAIEDEFCYEQRVKIIHGSIETNEYGKITMSFNALDEIEEEEIREVQLDLITIY